MEEQLEKVRAALRLLGAAVVERPMPAITTGGERSFYSPSEHTVVLATGAPQQTLWHELAHSQQPAVKAVAYYRTDGSVDAALWVSDPREQEAMAVELLVPLLDRCAGAVVAALRLLGEDDAIFASAIAQPLVLAKWVEHVLAGAVDAPKPHVARRTRRAINALTGAWMFNARF